MALSKMLPHEQENINQKEPAAIDYENPDSVDQYFKAEFPDIQPTALELFKGKVHAYRIAVHRAFKENEEQEKRERINQFKQMWSAKEMGDFALSVGKEMGVAQGFDFVIDDYNRQVFKLLCLYFTEDPEFEKYGIGDKKYSLRKGIWLQSPTRGSGKSILLRCFYINKRCCFGYKHSTELATMFQKNAFEGIDPFIGTLPQPPSPINFYQTECGFMYDELFHEEKVNHMGSPLLLSSYLINKLYDFSSNYRDKKWKFHCTSNADGEDIERIAGKTFRSRMPDMFNLIKLEGPDRRI